MDFNERVVVVTGAARGIGLEIVRGFHRHGATVIMVDLKEEDLRKGIADIAPEGSRRLHPIAGDIARPEIVEALFHGIKEQFGQLDILVNNAGITRDNLFMRMKFEEWQQVIDVNLTGAFLCTRQAVGLLRKSTAGRIVNISSVAAKGNPGQANYSASKSGLIGLTKTLALELARYSITVNAVAPGFIDTEMTRVLPDKARDTWLEKIPAQRPGSAQDVSHAVLFLCSGNAGYVTGQVLGVDGGLGI